MVETPTTTSDVRPAAEPVLRLLVAAMTFVLRSPRLVLESAGWLDVSGGDRVGAEKGEAVRWGAGDRV